MDFSSVERALLTVQRRAGLDGADCARAQEAAALLAAAKAADAPTGAGNCSDTRRIALELLGSGMWEAQAVGLALAEHLVAMPATGGEGVAEGGAEEAEAVSSFHTAILSLVFELLEHDEPRVRTMVVRYLGAAARTLGVVVHEQVGARLIASVKAHYVRALDGAGAKGSAVPLRSHPFVTKRGVGNPAGARSLVAGKTARTAPSKPLLIQLSHDAAAPAPTLGGDGGGDGGGGGGGGTAAPDVPPSSGAVPTIEEAVGVVAAKVNAVDDTTGWKSLETSLSALQTIMAATGEAFVAGGFLDADLAEVLTHCARHLNRHVRAEAFGCWDALAGVCPPDEMDERHADAMVRIFKGGLEDNWSQVRYAASVATRTFMCRTAPARRVRHHAALVPRMCMNRYYIADGVKLYSQETWRRVMGTEGPTIVAGVVGDVVEYYRFATDADNHAVRECACACIAELAQKVEPAVVTPHVDAMLESLLICFRDQSWPVRDAACVATGRFVGAFPEGCRARLPELYPLWFAALTDNIWSVREDSAVALAQIAAALGDESLAKVQAKLRELLPMAHSQPEETREAREARILETAQRSGQTMFSCGSLAPKLKKGGCGDCEADRAKEPWEMSEGAMRLVCELAELGIAAVEEFLPAVAELATLRHFAQADTLQKAIWEKLPALAHHLGKKDFKRHMQQFLEPLYFSLTGSSNRLTQHAAAQCIGSLSKLVGPSIFKGRLSEEWAPAMLPHCAR
jgi:hypothetical protein